MVLADLPRVSSARAAEIVDVGYEGFRSYLKRGLLGRVGMLPGFHKAGADTHDDPTPRSKWMMFGFADLCLMRIAKILMDSGFTFESANGVVSQHEIWSYMRHDDGPVERYLLIGRHMATTSYSTPTNCVIFLHASKSGKRKEFSRC